MLKGLLKYLFVLVILFVFWNCFLGYYPFLFIFVFITVFTCSSLISFICMRKTDIKLTSLSVIERDTPLQLNILLIHHSFIHCSKVIVHYKIIDAFDNEVFSDKSMIYGDRYNENIIIEHSGYYRLIIDKVYYFDILQCLSIHSYLNREHSFYVFPKITQIDKYLKQNISYALEANEYDILNKGKDYSEVFEIRSYNEFDSLKHIHWKASMKKGELFVKEGSQPILKKLLITIELSENKKTNDISLDIFYSLCLSLLAKGIDYEIICPALNDQKFNIETIKSDIHFKECFQRILSTSYHDIEEFIQSIKEYSTLYIVNSEGIEVREI